ncbi:hypothetical protein WA026_018924 [Henosepilachna vigintioctopunctata]|uniref:Nucleoside diphosphate kinase-like domain-containing protein n=1 Tax=Henosepilachna vigintioctopunctata TaxID=420089 RepID=A0AAW1UNH6_9CUCU
MSEFQPESDGASEYEIIEPIDELLEAINEEEILLKGQKQLQMSVVKKPYDESGHPKTKEDSRDHLDMKDRKSHETLTELTGERGESVESSLHSSHTSSCLCLPDLYICVKHGGTFSQDEEATIKSIKQSGIYIWKEDECPCLHEEKLYPSLDGSTHETITSDYLSPKSMKNIICSYKNTYQRTIVMVKPEAMIFKEVIKRAFLYVGGLNIINERILHLTPEQVSDIYSDEYFEKLDLPLFVLQMSRKPISVLSIGGLNAIEIVKSMVGPDKIIPSSWFFPSSIRHRIRVLSDVADAMHVSEDVETAATEGRYFYSHSIFEPYPKTPLKVKDYCMKYINPILNQGLAAVAYSKPQDPVSFLAEWLLLHNTYRPFYRPAHINKAAT